MAEIDDLRAQIKIWEPRAKSGNAAAKSNLKKLQKQLKVLESAPAQPVATQVIDKPEIVGYRRVYDGGCKYCLEAAQLMYHSGNLMPLHEHCGCGIAPVYSDDPFASRGFHPEGSGEPDPELGMRLDQTGPVPEHIEKAADAAKPAPKSHAIYEMAKSTTTPAKVLNEKVAARFPEGTVPTEADIEKEFADWVNSLTDDQAEILADYVNGIGSTINHWLRNQLKRGDDWDEYGGATAKYLDSLMKPLDRDTLVTRGLGDSFVNIFGHKPEVGGTLDDRAYQSSSMDPNVGDTFANDGNGVVVKILCPAGTPAAWLSGYYNASGEKELLLARDLTLEIVEIVDEGHIIAKVVPTPKRKPNRIDKLISAAVIDA